MRTILIILQKEFRQIFRNRAMLPIIFVMPVLQLLVLSFAATFEVRETPISVLDLDGSQTSQRLLNKLEASDYFTIVSRPVSADAAAEQMLAGRVKMILELPRGMERDLGTLGVVTVQMILNAQDGAAAGIIQAYAGQVLQAFNLEIQARYLGVGATGAEPDISGDGVTAPARIPAAAARVSVVPRHWYNPNLEYTTFMVPGILVLLVTMIGTFLSAMNVVREKEIGTIEQLNVTPIQRYQFITAKLLPFWIIALFELAVGLVIARLVFAVPMLGSMPLVFAMAGVYLLVMLGFGLFISTVTDTQQQAMFIAWFIMVVFILMSGLFTPIESMPPWAQWLTRLNPIAYFIEIMRRILLKGAGFGDIQTQFWSLTVYAVLILSLAVTKYRKVTA